MGVFNGLGTDTTLFVRVQQVVLYVCAYSLLTAFLARAYSFSLFTSDVSDEDEWR